MKKKTWYNILSVVLMVTMFVGMNEQVVFSDASDELPVSRETVSKNGTEKVNPLGHIGQRTLVERERAVMPECITFTLPDTGWSFQQSFARGELFDAFQSIRDSSTGREHWWYYADNSTEKVPVEITETYVYDYELEKAAMQRAIEQVFSYSHKRPNTVSATEVYDDLNSPYWWCRNTNELVGINKPDSNGSVTAQQILDSYMEEDKPSGGQDHRRAILTDSYSRIGIGCVKLADGRVYTAIALAEPTYEYDYVVNNNLEDFVIPLGEYTAPVDGYKEVEIELGICVGLELGELFKNGKTIELVTGNTYSVKENCKDKYFVHNGDGFAFLKGDSEYLTGWTSENNAVATVDANGVITAVGAGKTNIVAAGTYYYAVIPVTVTAASTQPTTPTPPGGDNPPPLEITPGDEETGDGTEIPNPPLEITPGDEETPPEEVKSFTKKYKNVYYRYDGKNVTAYASTNKESVTIPKTITYKGKTYKVTKIGEDCFKGKTKLQTIKIEANITSIGARAFKGCTKLKKITIPKTVTSIGKDAFEGCKKLTNVTIGKGVTKIGSKAFYNCKSLKKITIKGTKLKSVGKNAFTKINQDATIKVPSGKLKAYKKLLKGKYTKGVKIRA